jgi:hypothetical protein
MNHLVRRAAGVIAAAILVAVVPLVSRAADSNCASNIVIFGGNTATGQKVNSDAVVCDVPQLGTKVDGRNLTPGSDFVSVRYLIDTGADSVLTGHIKGLGLDKDFTLTRGYDSVPNQATGAYTMNSEHFAIDSSLSGCITAVVHVDPADPDSDETDTFHTLGATCE